MDEPSEREISAASLAQEIERQAVAMRKLHRRLRHRRKTTTYLRNISQNLTLIHEHLDSEKKRSEATLTAWLRRRLAGLRNRIWARVQRLLSPS
jgi:hypothetical protein